MATNANSRTASARKAKSSRRQVRSGGAGRHYQERWIRPFRRTHRAIDSSLRLIALSRFLLNECEAFAGVRPRWATRQIERVSRRLAEASARLERGTRCMFATHTCVAYAPETAGNSFQRLTRALEDWVDAAMEISLLCNRLDDTSARLAAYLKSGMAPPLDLVELLEKEGPTPKLIVFRLPSPRALSIESNRIFCIHVRRQRSARVTLAEAPRRIFRGRAPPLVSICPL